MKRFEYFSGLILSSSRFLAKILKQMKNDVSKKPGLGTTVKLPIGQTGFNQLDMTFTNLASKSGNLLRFSLQICVSYV